MSQVARLHDFSNGNFQVVMDALPEFVNNITSITLPGITVTAPEIPNQFISISMPGDHIEKQDIVVKFLLNENYENYIDLYNWIVALSFPQNTNQYKALIDEKLKVKKIKYDLSVAILNNKYNPIGRYVYVDCFPTSISSLEFAVDRTEMFQQEAEVTFRYSYFFFERD